MAHSLDITLPPWRVETIRLTRPVGDTHLAIVGAPGPARPVALITDVDTADDQDRANANLAAGAPHMFAAIVAAVNVLRVVAAVCDGRQSPGAAADLRSIARVFDRIIADVPAGRRPF